MMETMPTTKKVVMGCSLGSQETYLRETMLKMNAMAMERCLGLMDPFTRDSGRKVFNMDTER